MIHCLLRRTIVVIVLSQLILLVSTPALSDDREALRKRLVALAAVTDAKVDGAPIAALHGITKVYEQREWMPAWTDRRMVSQLYDQVVRSVEHGLNPDDFHLQQLQSRLEPGVRGDDPAFRVDTEILCSDALARLAVTLKFGKLDPTALDPAWNFQRSIDGKKVVEVFNEILDRGDIANSLEALAPNLDGYVFGRRALVEYREIMARGGWPNVPEGETLERGSTGSRVATLSQRLTVTGDLQAPEEAFTEFNEQLEAAVKRFQSRHGITADGKVGPRTLEELNVPVAVRIDQMRANLERVRWVFRDVEDDFILVDITSYRLVLVEGREMGWTTNVQVGKPYHATPVFKSALKYVEFNPTWTVPTSITRKELLPKIRKDPNYLKRNNMNVVTQSGKIVDPATIDWAASASSFPYMLRQEPGTNNALGQVKFIFPNKYSVYLHDTPSKGLFARTERAFSHGCIRTQNPFDLAERLLDDQGWDRARIDKVIESKKTVRVHFERPITVMLLYWTADADADGVVYFRKDVYNRDPPIIEGLNEPFRVDPPRGARSAVDES
jgi:murein L,D-transpeptidase YcbB/YkuD